MRKEKKKKEERKKKAARRGRKTKNHVVKGETKNPAIQSDRVNLPPPPFSFSLNHKVSLVSFGTTSASSSSSF